MFTVALHRQDDAPVVDLLEADTKISSTARPIQASETGVLPSVSFTSLRLAPRVVPRPATSEGSPRAGVMVLPFPGPRSIRGTLYSTHRKEDECSNAPSRSTVTVPHADTPARGRVAGPQGRAD